MQRWKAAPRVGSESDEGLLGPAPAESVGRGGTPLVAIMTTFHVHPALLSARGPRLDEAPGEGTGWGITAVSGT